MLRKKGESLRTESPFNPLMDAAQSLDGRKQPQSAAGGGEEQLEVSGGDPVRIILL